MSEAYLWRDAAEVTYPDWVGTAQLDERMTGAGLNEVLGLDPDEWFLIGFDIGGGEHRHELRVVAVHHTLTREETDILPKIAATNNGEIPATEFLVHDVDPYDVLRRITHQFEMRLKIRGSRELPIRILSESDIPELWMQED